MVAGTTHGRYEIRHEIGEGGMGVVYLARDTQLHRDVAVKILRPDVANDADRVTRFRLEARAASVLNHPNVITIHDVVEDGEQVLIISEFVKGTTLREKISRNQLTYTDSIKIARQAADALAAAHEVGIVHRDIKPENIMIRHDGYVKILDFGLAKQGILAIGSEDDQTLEQVKTQKGQLMGSISYMAPEQVCDAGFDERTDIWSLGVVFYEMLSGVNPFRRETAAESIGAILHVEPEPIERLVSGVSRQVAETIRTAMKKDPLARHATAGKFAAALADEAISGSNGFAEIGRAQDEETVRIETHKTDETATRIYPNTLEGAASRQTTELRGATARKRWWKRKLILVPAAILAGVCMIAAYNFFHPNLFPNSYSKFERFEMTSLTNDGQSHSGAISPDGRSVAFVRNLGEKQSLVLKEIETGNEKEIVSPAWAEFLQPTFTRDGKEIFYVKRENDVGTLYSTDPKGLRDRKLIVDVDSRISFSPDGHKFAFIRHDSATNTDTIFIANRYIGLEASLTKRLTTSETQFKRFNEVSWQNANDQFTVVGVLQGELGGELGTVTATTYGERDFFERGLSFYSLGRRELKNYTWLDDGTYFFLERSQNGDERLIRYGAFPFYRVKERITGGGGDYSSIDVAADGSAIASTRATKLSGLYAYTPGLSGTWNQLIPETETFSPIDGVSMTASGKILYARKTDEDVFGIHNNNGVKEKVWESKAIHIFNADPDGSNERRLTFDGDYNRHPTPTRDGKSVLFVSDGTISRMSLDGASPTKLAADSYAVDGIQITPDSKTVIYTQGDKQKMALMKMSIDGGEPERLILNSESSDFNPRISPDGKYLAYISVYYDKATSNYKEVVIVTSLRAGTAGDPVLGKEFRFASSMHWSPDSKSLCFIEPDGKLRCHSITDNKETAMGSLHLGQISNLRLSSDGKKLLFISTRQRNDVVLLQDLDRKP